MISLNYSEQYEITAIFDRSLKGSVFDGQKIEDPLNIEEFYSKGLFSSVAICVLDKNAVHEIKKTLEKAEISLFRIPSKNIFINSQSFSVYRENDQPDLPEGYKHFILHDLYGANCGINDSLFMFDRRKNLNKDYLYDYQIDEYDFQHFPIPYSKEDIENAFFLAGEYCMLAKLYNMNYWHFTYEALDQIYLLEKHGFSGKYILQHTGFAEELIKMFGIDVRARVIWCDDLPVNRVLRFEYVHLYSIGQDKLRYSAPVLSELANYLAQKSETVDHNYPKKIFVKRITNRKLLHVEKWIDQHGFFTIVPEKMTIEQQIRYFSNAELVLSPHGANSANSIYMKPGSVFIETFPDTYYNASNFETLYYKKVFYLPVIKSPVIINGHNDGNRNVDYQIPENLLDNAACIAETILKVKGE